MRIPRGTVLEIDGHSSTELSTVTLAGTGLRASLEVSDRSFRGRLQPTVGGTFAWAATGRNGAIEDLPPALQLEVQADSAPRVEILSPGRDTLVLVRDTIGVSVLATDDHGLSTASLRVTQATSARATAAAPSSTSAYSTVLWPA